MSSITKNTKINTFIALISVILIIPSFSGCLEFSDEYKKAFMPQLGLTFHAINGDYYYAESYFSYLGIKTIRYDIEWQKAKPKPNQFNYTYLNHMLTISKFYHERGYTQILVVWSPPSWAYELSHQEFISSYQEFLSKMIEISKNNSAPSIFYVDYIQIGNEYNNPVHSKVFNNWPKGEIYRFITTSIQTIKAQYPSQKTAINFQIIPNWYSYIISLLKYYIPEDPFVDILAVDYYPASWNMGINDFSELRRYLELLDDYNGLFNGSIFETGYPTPIGIEPDAYDHQEKYYEKSIPQMINLLSQYNSKLTSKSYIDFLMFYCLENYNNKPSNPEFNFGLVEFDRETGKEVYIKPAFYQVRYLIHSYTPTLFGSFVRLPFSGLFLSYRWLLLYFIIIFVSGFLLGYAYYTSYKVNQPENFDKPNHYKYIYALKYAFVIDLLAFIFLLIPLNIIWIVFLIPPIVYITTKNKVLTIMSLVNVIVILVLYNIWMMAGIYIL